MLKDRAVYLCLNYGAAEYYGLAAQVLPEEYYVNRQRDATRYENVFFINDTEQELDKNGCYIVWETYDGFLNYLEENGFRKEQKVGSYLYMLQ